MSSNVQISAVYAWVFMISEFLSETFLCFGFLRRSNWINDILAILRSKNHDQQLLKSIEIEAVCIILIRDRFLIYTMLS